MSPAHAGPNTSGLYALGNISPVVPFGNPHTTSDGSEENVLPTPPSGSAKTGGRDALKRGPSRLSATYPQKHGAEPGSYPAPAPESRTFHRLPKTQ